MAAGLLIASGSATAEAPDYRGFIELENNRYPVFASNPQQVAQERALKFQLEASYKASQDVAFGVRAFIRKDAYNNDRDVARFDELWWQYATPKWDVRVGNQLVTWGSVESVSPLDIVNPRDYEEDVVEPIKVGTPAVRVRRRFEDGDFSLYWLPYFEASRFSGPQSFYSISGGLPNHYPASVWQTDQWAARYFHTGDGFDYGVSYFNGLERNASFEISPAGDSLVGRTFRAQRFGFETTKVVGNLLLKGEFVYRTTHEEGNRRALLYALGAEYTISSVWRHSDLTLFAEYLASSRNVKELELMQNDIFAAARWTISDHYKQQLQVGLFWDLDHRQAHVYRLEYKASPTQNVDAGIRYTYTRDYFPGPHHTEKKDGVLHMFLKYNF
jgi:hypothetical protein